MLDKLRKDIRAVFDAGLQAADPKEALRHSMRVTEDNRLIVGDHTYDLMNFRRILVVGAGKAASPMAQALEDILGERIKGGHVTTKYGHGRPLAYISLREAGHPVPDEEGVKGSGDIVALLEGANAQDLVLCLISGGGSALMPLPAEGLSLAEKQQTTQILLECGATIHEINAIRKHISRIKGGRLAKLAYPASVITLILSDVVGDDLDVIASGPTVADRSTFADCLRILDAYKVRDKVPAAVRAYLERGGVGEEEETPKSGDSFFEKTVNHIVGSAGTSLKAAEERARSLGYRTLILSSCIEGETREVAKVHAAIAKEVTLSGNPLKPPACIISGGETTVTLRGNGKGGRNTEFALAAAIAIDDIPGVVILSGGTDGTDGPTDAAGAVVDGDTVNHALEKGKQAAEYLEDNNSYTFFENSGELLITGPTMTNVMDLRIMLISRYVPR